MRKNRPLVPRSNSRTPFFLPGYWVFHGSGGCRTAIQVCRTTFHVFCYGSPHHSFGVYLSMWLTVGSERVRMSWRNAPENFFPAVRGCPQSCARTNPWFRGPIWGGKRAEEPPAGSAVKHCRFLGTGRGLKWSGCSVRIWLWLRLPHSCHRHLSNLPMFGGASARGLFSSSSLVPVSARCIRFLGSTGLCVHPGQRSLPSRGAAVAGPIRPH